LGKNSLPNEKYLFYLLKKQNMNKKELINVTSKKTGINKKEIVLIVNTIIDTITEELKK